MAVSSLEPMDPRPVPPASAGGTVVWGMQWSEIGFVLLLVGAMVCVFLSGRFAWREASLFQQAKDNGQALVGWATAVAAAHEGKGHLAPTACQRAAAETAADADAPALDWARCREQLLGAQGALSGMRNPFGPSAPVFSSACERGHYAGRGAVVLEKGTASPPGFPPSVSYGALEDAEPMVRGMLLRVLVCDPSGYGVRVAEVKL